MFDVAIIGAGVVGGMLARELAAYELHICVIEKENDVAKGATCANSGIVHAGYDAAEGSLKARLNVRGSEMMETVARELGVSYRRNGSLVVGFDEEDRAVLEKLYARGLKNGVKGLRILDGNQVREMEPNLSEAITCALYAPTGAVISPYELAIAAIGNAMDNGASLLTEAEVKRIEKKEDVYEIMAGSHRVCAKYVVNAAGIYADDVARIAGDDSFRIKPRRGEYILLDKTCGGLLSHTVFGTPSAKGKGILTTPTVDGNLLLGPTSVDMEDKDDKATTAEGFAQIMGRAGEKLKSVPFNKTITSFCGLRAVGDTGDFIITSPEPGFVNAAGIESPGLTAAPAIAEYVIDMLAKQGLVLNKKADYEPVRKASHIFREASVEEKNEMIRRDKAYGRVVCRCETVTEGEILEAIHRNPPARDLDGIKRRTRAQMGRCQGGFCMPHIADILARELGIPYEAVTKSGRGSEINLGRTK